MVKGENQMAQSVKFEGHGRELVATLRDLFHACLDLDDVRAILLPCQLPLQKTVMPVLVSDPDRLNDADPLAPAFPVNSAKMVARLTRKPFGGKIIAVMRPCEIRAFVELVKLKQGGMDELVIIGTDCLGALTNRDFMAYAGGDPSAATQRFIQGTLNGSNDDSGQTTLATACRVCEQPLPHGADIAIGLYGADLSDGLLLQPQTDKGTALTERLQLAPMEIPANRKALVDELLARRKEARDKMFADTHQAVGSIEKLSAYLGACVNCYNCRVACPVCYCKECVFVTDVFNHQPIQYLRWSDRKGAIKMPTDTVFYHITRLAHMSTACVGCGQCSNACPNDIPVMELFRTVAWQTQQAFDYTPGRDVGDSPPLSVFREDEFTEVVGV